jgi:RHS repeat-associated protein
VEAYSFAADKKLEFVYDYLGRRVEKKVTQISTVTVTGEERFLYDVWNLIATYQLQTSNLTLQTSYTWGLDLSQTLQGAGGVGGLLGVEEISGAHQGLYAFAFDVNGNVSEVYDDTGAVAAHYEYSPFGEVTRSNGAYADANAFRFSTKYLDAETGFYYYGYRYYDAETGRWLSRDPIEESGGINLYGFVGNDTVNQWDYLGMFNWRDPWGGGQGFIPGRNTAARLQNGAIGATSGAAAGATVGAGVGAAIGAVGAGVGAAPGAVAGATAGGIGGAISGFISGVTANPNASAGSVATGGAISGAFSGLTGGAGGALGATAGRGGTTALTHYASSQNAAIINSTQQLGRSASSSLWATTGRAAGTTVAGRTGVAITGQAASAFRPVVAAGPLSAYGRFAGFNSAGSGVLSLSNGAYLSGGGINGQLARWYGLDALTNGVIGFTTPPLFGCK